MKQKRIFYHYEVKQRTPIFLQHAFCNMVRVKKHQSLYCGYFEPNYDDLIIFRNVSKSCGLVNPKALSKISPQKYRSRVAFCKIFKPFSEVVSKCCILVPLSLIQATKNCLPSMDYFFASKYFIIDSYSISFFTSWVSVFHLNHTCYKLDSPFYDSTPPSNSLKFGLDRV